MKTVIGWILVLCIGYFFIAAPPEKETQSKEISSPIEQQLLININNIEIDTLEDQLIKVEKKCSKATDSITTQLYKNIQYLKQVDK